MARQYSRAVLRPNFDGALLLKENGYNQIDALIISNITKAQLTRIIKHEGVSFEAAREFCRIADVSFRNTFEIGLPAHYLREMKNKLHDEITGDSFWLLRHRQQDSYTRCFEDSNKGDRFYSFVEVKTKIAEGEWTVQEKGANIMPKGYIDLFAITEENRRRKIAMKK